LGGGPISKDIVASVGKLHAAFALDTMNIDESIAMVNTVMSIVLFFIFPSPTEG
jgi:hypothetical protein